MIVDERMVTYIRSLERPENPVIEAIEQEALDSFVPIIRKETQSFLKVMMLMNRPARVLEVGTAVGFSAILMSEYLPEGSHITTIENYEKRIPIARNNFKRAGKEEQITLIEGDALRGHALGIVVDQLLGLGVHHGVGDLDLHVLHDLLDQGVLKSVLSGVLAAGLQLVAQVFLQIGQGLKLGHVLGKLVIHRGKLLLLDLVDLDLEHHRGAGQLLAW